MFSLKFAVMFIKKNHLLPRVGYKTTVSRVKNEHSILVRTFPSLTVYTFTLTTPTRPHQSGLPKVEIRWTRSPTGTRNTCTQMHSNF